MIEALWRVWAWGYFVAMYPLNRRSGWSRTDLLALQRITLKVGR